MSPEPRLRVDPGPAAVVAAGVVVLTLSVVSLPGGGEDDLGDFLIGSARWLATGTPYAPPGRLLDVGEYAYPPLLAWLLAPLAPLSRVDAHAVWWVVHLVAFGFLCRAFTILVSGTRRVGHDVLWAAFLIFNMSRLVGIKLGQLQDVVDAMVAWVVVLSLRGRDGSAGVLLGVVTALKVFPGALALPLVLERRWKALGAFLATLLAVVALGPRQHWTYLMDYLVGARVPLPLSSPHVMSAPAIATRLFHEVQYNTTPVVHAPVAEVVTIAVLDGLLLATALLARGTTARWAAGLLLAVTLSPGVGVYHVAIPILGLGLAAAAPDGASWLRVRWTAPLFLALLLYLPCEYGLGVPIRALRVGWGTLLLSPHVHVLAAGLVAIAWTSRAEPAGDAPAP